jgi:ABC-type multidrug transport system permease subunit
LDSENALAVTKLLKRLCASKNVAAMMVIHQPNGALFREFDRLVLLQKGETVFSDDTSRLPVLYEDVFKTEMPEWYDMPSDLMTQVADLPPNELVSDSKELVPTIGHCGHIVPPGAFWKFRAVFCRNLTNHYVRNITNLASRLGLYGATSLIDGLLFWQVADIAGGVNVGVEISTVVGALTFIILVSYLLPFAMLPVFVYDKKFFLAESGLGLYSPWLYCLSQIILETWVVVLAATIEACIVIPMCGLWNPAMARWESFFTFLGALIVSGLTGSALVLFHAIVLPSQDLAFLAGSGAVTISLALSGGFVPFPSIEDFISWLQWISPCKYTLQALALTFFRGTTYEELVHEIYAFDNPPTVSDNIGVLLAFFAALAGGTMFALSRQREVR